MASSSSNAASVNWPVISSELYVHMHMYITVGPVLNAWFNDCVLRILPTLRI